MKLENGEIKIPELKKIEKNTRKEHIIFTGGKVKITIKNVPNYQDYKENVKKGKKID